ncbi:general transcription factor IIH subunit TFB6 family, partial [Aspergillus alliaceus]|uniref:general transcription factor IIH subunit TFB6 family n=1 Tax=Petromyces alliaceus TaxID=209559 RepID=UPI0012A70740
MSSSTTSNYEPGGFMQSPLSSPAPLTSTDTPSILPKPRSHPLKPGSAKEAFVINHVDKTILTINRRHAKKFSSVFDDQAQQESEKGYESFKEVAKDIEGLVDVLWVTGTPSLQIPYLISLAVYINTYLPEYPFSPKATFRLLKKLDSIFASLLTGEDADSGAPLAGFETRRNIVSMTEKVRIKSIAETCRVAVVEAREQVDGPDDEDADDFSDEDDDMDDVFGTEDYLALARWEMETARVFEKTIQLLGDELGKAGEFCDTVLAPGDTCQAET